MKLTPAREKELQLLSSRGPQHTFGSARARVQQTLVDASYARFVDDRGRACSRDDAEFCVITNEGRGALRVHDENESPTQENKMIEKRGPKVHILKCWPDAFNATSIGLKHHEVRIDDRDYQVGDQLLLKYWDPKTRKYHKNRKAILVEVAYKTNGGEYGLPKELCVMSIQHIDRKNSRLCCAMLHPAFTVN